MSLYLILWLAGILAEAGVVILCIRGRLFRSTPIFSSYVVWSLFIDIAFLNLQLRSSPTSKIYYWSYVPQMIMDSLFQFGVILELGWSILRPIRTSLPKHSLLILSLLIVVAGVVIWPVAGWVAPGNLPPAWRTLAHLQQTFAVLRVILFLGLAGFSQMLSIGWRNRELQVATGLGFYSMMSLAAAFIHTHQVSNSGRFLVDEFVMASYVCSLFYWIVSFAQKEEVRQEFTPQMRSFLLAVTGAARTSRVALADSGIGRSQKTGKP